MSRKQELAPILEKAKEAAIEFYKVTGKPLGITGEIGEYVAARELDLELMEARSPGYDAVAKDGRRIQIKTRSIPSHKRAASQRLGAIKYKYEWDAVILVLLDEFFEPVAMYEADRPDVVVALTAPGSKARNERNALSISKFKSIGRLVWGSERP